jgi:UDP-N-acetylglucosamine 4-epimerase
MSAPVTGNMPKLDKPYRWFVTGVAGFIGSNLLEQLLRQDQLVVGVDNFSTGYQSNLDTVRDTVGTEKWKNFSFHDVDICSESKMLELSAGCDFVL